MFKKLLNSLPHWSEHCHPLPSLSSLNSKVDVLRLDQIDEKISGNKPLKLLGWFKYFLQQPQQVLLSFGGVYSNHLHALAYAAHEFSIPVVFIVRGWADQPLTPTLADCQALGAQIVFVDRQTYAKRYDRHWQAELAQQYDALVIPEGGAGELGEQGCALLAPLAAEYDEVWLAVGSGTTALGLAKGLSDLGASTLVVGVNAVADQGEQAKSWQKTMPKGVEWRLIDDAHFGGFAKCPPELVQLIKRYQQQGLPLDPVYTAKLIWAYEQSVLRLPPTKTVRTLIIHSGGLQGQRGMQQAF